MGLDYKDSLFPSARGKSWPWGLGLSPARRGLARGEQGLQSHWGRVPAPSGHRKNKAVSEELEPPAAAYLQRALLRLDKQATLPRRMVPLPKCAAGASSVISVASKLLPSSLSSTEACLLSYRCPWGRIPKHPFLPLPLPWSVFKLRGQLSGNGSGITGVFLANGEPGRDKHQQLKTWRSV